MQENTFTDSKFYDISNDLFELEVGLFKHLTALSADRLELLRLVGTCGVGTDEYTIYSNSVDLNELDQFHIDMLNAISHKLCYDLDAFLTYAKKISICMKDASDAVSACNEFFKGSIGLVS